MAEPKTTGAINEAEAAAPEELTQKKEYEKPQIVYRAPLEAMADVCTGAGGKAPAGVGCIAVYS